MFFFICFKVRQQGHVMRFIFNILKKLGKTLNFIRLLILNSLFLALIIVLFITLSSEDDAVTVAKNTTLQLNFTGEIVDQRVPFDFSSEISKQALGTSSETENQYQIEEVLQVINHATLDENVNAILLDTSNLTYANLNHIAEIGKALNEFKAAGKTVTSVSDNYSQLQYLLASFADKIYLAPQGMVFLPGYSVYRLYFKELLDNLLITPHIFKVGTYKSFVEPYTNTTMSSPSRMANSNWLNQLWDNYIATVTTQRSDLSEINRRSVSPSLEALKSALLIAKGDSAVYAKQVGLVDELKTRFNVMADFEKESKNKGNTFTLLTYDKYRTTLPDTYLVDNQDNKVAVIYASGEILSGEQPTSKIGGDTLSTLIQTAIDDDQVKAVVLRINSPGGSAFASEKIRQQILSLKAKNKTIVVSMGSVAASGGYWIAAPADYIYATPTTLTGSIGIFGLYASAEKALNKIGIYNDGVATTPLAGISPTRALDPALAEILQIGIESGYRQFLEVVSQGRNISVTDVDKIAQGRVWTGSDAVKLGLVDSIGNLTDAINKAAELADLKGNFNTIEIKVELSSKQQMINELLLSSASFLPKTENSNVLTTLMNMLSVLPDQATALTSFDDPKGQYIYCVMCAVK